MSNERDYPNSGILFRDDKKQSDRDRDYKGTGDIDCPHCGGRLQFWISGWIKQGRKGKFISFSFKAKEESTARQAAPATDSEW
jgi:hypothetical protein